MLNGTTPVTGSFAFATPTTLPAAGTRAESVTFTPTDTTNYSAVTGVVNVTVNQATPTITWPTASSIAYGQALASSALTGGTALDGTTSVTGAFAFATPTTVPTAGTHSESVTFTPTDTADYATVTGTVSVTVTTGNLTITWPTASAIAYGQTLASSTLSGGSVLSGTTAVTGTFVFTTPATAPPIGTNAQNVTFTPADTANYSAVTGSVNVTVRQAGTTTTLTATGSSINPGSSLTLTATVVPTTSGTPTGTVTFSDGSTTLGTATLAAGVGGDVATLSTSALLSGSHTITATYIGDANFIGSSTTSSLTITVAPLGLTISASPAAQNGSAGGMFTYQLSVAPAFAGTPYPGSVTFAAVGGPSGAVFTFSPSSVAANAGPQTVTMSVATPAKSAALHPDSTGRTLVPVALAFLLLPLAGTKRMRRNGQRLARFVCLLLLALGGIVVTTALSGCGSNSGGTSKTDNGTQYTITVTAISGSANPTATVTLTLQ